MMHIVQTADLRKETGECLIVVLAIIDCSSPVVAPLDHGTRLQTVGAYLVNVFILSQSQLRPITKCQQILQMARSKERTPFLG